MCNGQLHKVNVLAKALDNSGKWHQMFLYLKINILILRLCRVFLLDLTWPGNSTIPDANKVHTEIQNMMVDHRHFTPIIFCTNFVLDDEI